MEEMRLLSQIRISRRDLLKCFLTAPIAGFSLSTLTARAFAWRQKVPGDVICSDLLFEGSARIDNFPRDLKGNDSPVMPTVEYCQSYRQLVWLGYKSGNAPLNFSLRARATDLMGMPLNFSWRILGTGVIRTSPNAWFRVAIPEGHWDQYRIELTSSSPQQIYSRLLGIRDASIEKSQLAKTLLVRRSLADPTERDLLGTMTAEYPTCDDADAYSRLIWIGVKMGSADVSFVVLARSTNYTGTPLSENWCPIATGTLQGTAGSWFRVETKQGYFDQYRIVVSSSTSQQIISKILGVLE